MADLPRALEHLVAELGKLPGVGRRSAERMAFALLAAPPQSAEALSRAAAELHERVGTCEVCGYYTEDHVCPMCTDTHREDNILCIVEDCLDVIAFERSASFRGRYHVLGGVLSPLKGVTPDDLNIPHLRERTAQPVVTEIILATSPSVEGDATAIYLADVLAREGLAITRIGRGVPVGGSLELIDGGTLRMAIEGRRSV